MIIPFWKKYLSYFFEWHLESRSSDYNPELHVSLVDGRYQLFTENAIYSFADLYHNFRQSFLHLQLPQRSITRELILGQGKGSIPYMLEKTFGRSYHYTAVEIDEEVIDLANKYVLRDLRSPRQLICADAHTFVAVCQEQFDMIAVDLFLDNIIPVRFEQTDFLQHLSQLLAPGGILLLNRMAETEADKAKTKAFFENTFLEVFPEGSYLAMEKNWMLFNKE